MKSASGMPVIATNDLGSLIRARAAVSLHTVSRSAHHCRASLMTGRIYLAGNADESPWMTVPSNEVESAALVDSMKRPRCSIAVRAAAERPAPDLMPPWRALAAVHVP